MGKSLERKATPSAAKGTLPLPGNVEIYVDDADDHIKMIDEAGSETDLTATAESTITGDVTYSEAADLIFGTTTGTKIGTASGQKIGFFGVTPVVKAAALTAVDSATVDGTYGSEEQGVLSNVRVRIGELSNIVKNLGISN